MTKITHVPANPLHQPSQRVGVFIDVQNFYYSAQSVFGKRSRVNFEQLLIDAVDGRNLVRAFAYVIRADAKKEDNFFDALENIGLEAKMKDLQIFPGGARKGDWDVGIAVDAIRLSPNLDTVILGSGDGDYVDLIQYLKGHGLRVEVFSFKDTTSEKIMEFADEVVDIGIPKYKL